MPVPMPFNFTADIQLDAEEVNALQAPAQWHAMNTFRVFYCIMIAGVICMHHLHHARFYRWFVGSGLQQEQRRGLGYAAVRPYGLFEPPRLTVPQFHAAGAALVASLVLACFDCLAPRVFLWSAFCLYFMYFSQLFCESKAGGHSTVMIPTTLFMLALAQPGSDAVWPLEVLKIYLALAYCASGVCKLAGSVYFGKFWGNGPTLQCYVYEAMWTRPAKTAAVRWAQEFLLCSPYACTVFGCLSLVFEAGFPAIFFTPHWCTVALGAGASLSFHAGIELLMGLDFLSYWCPVLLAFAAKDTAALATAATTGGSIIEVASAAFDSLLGPQGPGTLAALEQGLAAQPLALAAAAVYLLGQVVVSFTLRDILGEEKLPFSCCPMFFFPRNLFSATPKLFCLSGANWRKGGYLDCSWLYNQAFVPPFELRQEDLSRLQFPIVTFGTLAPMPEDLSFRVKPEYRDQPFVMFSNADLGQDLELRLKDLMHELSNAEEADSWRQDKLLKVLAMQKECRALFADRTATTWSSNALREKAE
mmetsp:Transcript_29529/g.84563  ORF Transcript_29529/g.84563 Transcript_29529/m.84563 type:complete len:531 (-) Transcript_29529:54-1646(-)